MRAAALALLLCACVTEDNRPGIAARDGSTGVEIAETDIVPGECPSCAVVGFVEREGTITIDSSAPFPDGQGWDYPLRFRARLSGFVNPDESRWVLATIEALDRESGEVVGDAFEARGRVEGGAFVLAWERMALPKGVRPYGGGVGFEGTLTLQLRGCLGRVAAMCGEAETTFDMGDHPDAATWGMGTAACPSACD